jgi:nucleotide-binding universal stress UspA family protein
MQKIRESEKWDEYDRNGDDEAIEAMKRHVEEFCRRAEPKTCSPCAELVSKIIVKEGHPPEEILTRADDEGGDVIVMGSHGKGFLSHTFLGSVSTALLHGT